jgi:N4-gp56 family major capsid protein
MATNLLLAPEIRQAYERKLLDRFRTTTVFNRFGDGKTIGKNQGVNLSWRRMEIIRPVAVASPQWAPDATYTSATGALLTEGTYHTPTVIASWYETTATIRQYGFASYLSDVNINQALDPQIPEYVENFGEAMSELLDLVTRDVLLQATNIQYANGRQSSSAVISGDFLNLVELRKAKRTLKRVNAQPVEDGKFVVLGHPDTSYDLEGDSNITNIWSNGGAGGKQGQIFDTTFKDLPLGFRYYESSICPISRASGYGDVYNTFVLGKQAYGTVKWDAIPSRVIVHMPGESGTADPLDQVATVGCKVNFVAAILNQNNMVLIKHQSSIFTGTRSVGPV